MDLKRALTYPLRLCPSIREQAEKIAKQDGISLNHFISLAVAEKLSRMEHDHWLKGQAVPMRPGLGGGYMRPPGFGSMVERRVRN